MRLILSIFTFLFLSTSYSADDPFDLLLTTPAPSASCKIVGNHDECHIYLLSQIMAPETYKEEYKLLSERKDGDIVYLHLSGPGGQGDGLVYLVNAIRNSKAKVVSMIDGSVASADAVLAVMNKDVIITGDAYIWFHNISLSNMVNETCESEQGRDRGIAQYTKCMENTPKLVAFYNSVINQYVYPLLTKEERVLYDQGHDIIIDSKELRNRLDNRGV